MKNQTAVDQLRERLFKEFGFAYSDNIHEELKAMEKEQLYEAFVCDTYGTKIGFEQYLNLKFEK